MDAVRRVRPDQAPRRLYVQMYNEREGEIDREREREMDRERERERERDLVTSGGVKRLIQF